MHTYPIASYEVRRENKGVSSNLVETISLRKRALVFNRKLPENRQKISVLEFISSKALMTHFDLSTAPLSGNLIFLQKGKPRT
jgi:hypothetical protein